MTVSGSDEDRPCKRQGLKEQRKWQRKEDDIWRGGGQSRSSSRIIWPRRAAKRLSRFWRQPAQTAIVLSPEESKYGAVETYTESQRCAELFKKHADEIDGIIVTLPNFGEERGIADAIRLAGLKVPVLVQATPDRSDAMTIATRRDSFCGKMSACNNLMQYGIPYSLTTLHTESLTSAEFKADLEWFSAVCRIVKGLKNLRIGAIGARPTAFNTVRYSERIFETSGITIETIDLSEIFGRINRMKDNDDAAQAKLAAIKKYVTHGGDSRRCAAEDGQAGRGDRRMDEADARDRQRGAVLDFDGGVLRRGAVHDHEHDVERADSLGLRSGCARHAEHVHDGAGVGHAVGAAGLEQQLRQRSQQVRLLPLLEPAEAFLQGRAGWTTRRSSPARWASENTFGTCVGRVKPGAMSFARYSTDDRRGMIRGYTGAGAVYRRSAGDLWRRGRGGDSATAEAAAHICREGFEHHVAANFSDVSKPCTRPRAIWAGKATIIRRSKTIQTQPTGR